MKRCYLIVLACFFLLHSHSQNNQAITNNGNWNNNSTWGLGHSPQNGEIAIVPQNYTIIIDDNVQLATDIVLKIYGNLNFRVGKLKLTANSAIYLYLGGNITSDQTNSSDKIEIGGVAQYSGNEGTLTGPLMANSGTAGFEPLPILLPVKFIAYSLSNAIDGIAIKWSTTEEINTTGYVVERSIDGVNWQVIGHVDASLKPSVLNNYSYKDKQPLNSIIYYRIKQTDRDNHFTYTPIKSIKPQSPLFLQMKISSVANNLVVELPQQVKGHLLLQLFAVSGQIIVQKKFYQSSGHIILPQGVHKGLYILSISNGQEIKMAKQVFLN
jgi:hypothetical protein